MEEFLRKPIGALLEKLEEKFMEHALKTLQNKSVEFVLKESMEHYRKQSRKVFYKKKPAGSNL